MVCEVDCGRLAPDEDASCEERERVLCLIATAARATTASPLVIAHSGCESDDCARVAGDESQLSDSTVGEVVIAITADNLVFGATAGARRTTIASNVPPHDNGPNPVLNRGAVGCRAPTCNLRC